MDYNWYKLSGKSYREDYGYIKLFHVSPEHLTRLSPRSNFRGHLGVYLSQSYESTIIDWASYVMSKKHKTHPLYRKRQDIIEKLDYLDDLKYKNKLSEEQKLEKNQLKEKFNNIDKERKLDNIVDIKYKSIYIHTVSCPKDTYKDSYNWFVSFSKEDYNAGNYNFGFWAWGEQVFIPEKYLNKLKIIKVEKLDIGELLDRDAKISQKVSELVTKPMFEREDLKGKINE